MNAQHPCPAAVICTGNGHEFDRAYGIGRCGACGQWVMTPAEYARARRQGYADRSPNDTYWAMIPARLGGGLAVRVEVEA